MRDDLLREDGKEVEKGHTYKVFTAMQAMG